LRAAQEEITKVGVDITTIRLNVLPGLIEGYSSDWLDTACGSATNPSRSIEPDMTPESRPGRAMPRQDVGAYPTQERMRDA